MFPLAAKYTSNCHSCVPPQQDAHRMILRNDICTAVLRTDQPEVKGWPTRGVVFTIRHITDPEELISVAPARKRVEYLFYLASQRLFNTDRGNYAEAGNLNKDEHNQPTSDPLYHHPHTHVIPRKQQKFSWRDKEFLDHSFQLPLNLDPKPTPAEQALNAELKVNNPLSKEERTLLKTDLQMQLVKMMFDGRLSPTLRPKWEEIEAAFPTPEVSHLYATLREETEKRQQNAGWLPGSIVRTADGKIWRVKEAFSSGEFDEVYCCYHQTTVVCTDLKRESEFPFSYRDNHLFATEIAKNEVEYQQISQRSDSRL